MERGCYPQRPLPLIRGKTFAHEHADTATVGPASVSGWKIREIDVRQNANHSQVRPRPAEQGPRLRGCDPRVGCKRIG